MSDQYGQSLVNDADTLLEGTWEWQGKEFALKCRNISYKDLRRVQQYGAVSATASGLGESDPEDVSAEDLEALSEQADAIGNFSWEDDGDDDWVASVIVEKLVKPDVDIESTSTPKLRALVEGMMRAWRESTDVSKAKEEMPVEGNP